MFGHQSQCLQLFVVFLGLFWGSFCGVAVIEWGFLRSRQHLTHPVTPLSQCASSSSISYHTIMVPVWRLTKFCHGSGINYYFVSQEILVFILSRTFCFALCLSFCLTFQSLMLLMQCFSYVQFCSTYIFCLSSARVGSSHDRWTTICFPDQNTAEPRWFSGMLPVLLSILLVYNFQWQRACWYLPTTKTVESAVAINCLVN